MINKSVYGGLFQDPPYISTDPDPAKTDPYVKQDCIPSRYLGKSLLPGPPKDYLSDKFLTLASTEQSADIIASNEKRMRSQPAGPSPKNISDAEFRYTSYPKKSTGPGSYYGCFQNKPYEYLTEPWDDGKKKKKAAPKPAENVDKNKHLPNIKVNPSKKGTYGYPGLLLSKEIFNEGWEERPEVSEKKSSRKRAPEPQMIGPVFRVQGVSRAYLDELPNTGVSAIYMDYQPSTSSKKNKAGHKHGATDVKLLVQKPFNWSSYKPTMGGCINPFPNIWIDPATLAEGKQNRRRRGMNEPGETDMHQLKGSPKWIPNSFGKTSVMSSCLRRFY
ncbi:unnamed protein product [Phytomonas sp. Hart1]|nr:unnamed protein product [Phytomonas sp. Hart1]|eukprot:CCW67278.1 unnamed protein product [Phytomonas sp. isolate Hart1]